MAIPTLGSQISGGGEDWIAREIADLRRELNELRAARTLEAATIGQGGLTVAGGAININGGALNVLNGDLTVSGTGNAKSGNYVAGTSGWKLAPNGNAEFNDLTIRGGIIGNDALTAPATFGSYGNYGNNTLTVAGSYLHSGTIAVPAGYSRALVICNVSIGGTNSTGGPDNIYAAAEINGVQPVAIASGAANGYAMSVGAAYARSLTGLSGGTIAVKAWGATDVAGWTGGNGHVSAVAIFLR